MNRQLGHNGAALIQLFEGLRLTTYVDQAGIPTAGYGHTGPDVHIGQIYTPQQVGAWFAQDTLKAVYGINHCVTWPLGQNQFDALVCWSYNVGVRAAANSTLVRLVNEGHLDQVPYQLSRWAMVHGIPNVGLLRRRHAEADLFEKPDEASIST